MTQHETNLWWENKKAWPFMELQRRHAQKNILMAENHERGAVTKTTIYYCFVLIKKII